MTRFYHALKKTVWNLKKSTLRRTSMIAGPAKQSRPLHPSRKRRYLKGGWPAAMHCASVGTLSPGNHSKPHMQIRNNTQQRYARLR